MNSESVIKIFLAGDFCSKPSTDLISISDGLKTIIQSCDLKLVNFEVPLKPENSNLPKQTRERFWQHDDSPSFLYNLGFNLFSLANNHMFDWGDEGYLKTKQRLNEDSFGAGTYDEAYKVKIISVKGIKIGFLSLTFNAYKGVFYDCDDHNGLGCAYINDLRVNHDIINAKKEVDYLFILAHDGIEYIDVPLPETIARYRDFIDYGADAVIGTHPHCPQGWEEYKGKPIFYSLGNFFFNSKQDSSYRAWNRPHWYEGRCVILYLSDKKIKYDVINTRNIDNTAIEVDYSDESKSHNENICQYIKDKNLYYSYLTPLLKQQYEKDVLRIRQHFEICTIKDALKELKRCLKKQCKDKNSQEFFYLLKNDLRLARLLRMMK